MCDPVSATIAGGALLSAGVSYTQGQKQEKQAERAAAQAQQNAEKQATAADRDMNRRNAKQPNLAALYSANKQSAQGGAAGTSLTGPTGVDPASLMLGRNTILGM